MSDGTAAGDGTAEKPALEEKAPGGVTLRGTPVAPGLALGLVHRKDHDLLRAPPTRVPLEQVERELNRFHRSLSDSRKQLETLKGRLHGRVPPEQVRILDTHLAYLKDSVFLADVENLILNEQMSLEAAIGKVVADFDRIFRLVQSETLRERAVDLRDVGIRVLRNLEKDSGAEGTGTAAPAEYVLVARELSIVDMFNLANESVLGIVTEEGGLTSHAAILARSMRIPTLTGVAGLLDAAREGAYAIVDATEGVVRLDPDEVVRAQYGQRSKAEKEITLVPEEGVPAWARRQPRTRDGVVLEVSGAAGNLPEVDQAASLGISAIGLYRTELLYLIDREQPSLEALSAHYASVVEHARGAPVTFRLLHVDSSLEVGYLHESRELNPALGRTGVRCLFAREAVLRRQLQALLRAVPADSDQRLRIAVPFVVDCGDLRRLKEILFEERYALRRAGIAFQEQVELGAIVETPAAVLGARDLAREADFLCVGLDSLQQYLLAADRENHGLARAFESLHPFVLRALVSIVEAAEQAARPLSVFGVTVADPANLPFLVGLGLRSFCIPPLALQTFLTQLAQVDARAARRTAALASRASCAAETQTFVEGYRHGLVR
ncbi:MAG: phosphoenolpyruvate--protein phosphotransferase [Planctomycetota bacterium]|nr:phosphoenolpyruvate--protein phosphotransferase [Planctomycetota bacterium]